MVNKKKGYELRALIGLGVTFVVIAIVLSFGGTILQNLSDDANDGLNRSAYNATQYGLSAIEEFASWLPTLAIIVVAAVIIGIIIRYFMPYAGVKY